MIVDAVTADVYAGRTVGQFLANCERHGESAGFRIILIVENQISEAAESRVEAHFLGSDDLGNVVKIIGVRREDRLRPAFRSDILVPSGKRRVWILRIGRVLRRDGLFAVFDGLRERGFSRIRIERVLHILAVLVERVESVGAQMHRAHNRVHREAVGGELNGLAVYAAVHVVNREAVRAPVLNEVEHVQIGVIVQRLAHKANADLNVANGLVDDAVIVFIHNPDIENSRERYAFSVRAHPGGAGGDIFIIAGVVLLHLGNKQLGSLHGDSSSIFICDLNFVGIPVGGFHGSGQLRFRNHVDREALRQEDQVLPFLGKVHLLSGAVVQDMPHLDAVARVLGSGGLWAVQPDLHRLLRRGLPFLPACEDADIIGRQHVVLGNRRIFACRRQLQGFLAAQGGHRQLPFLRQHTRHGQGRSFAGQGILLRLFPQTRILHQGEAVHVQQGDDGVQRVHHHFGQHPVPDAVQGDGFQSSQGDLRQPLQVQGKALPSGGAVGLQDLQTPV